MLNEFLQSLEPLQQNIVVTIITVVYVKSVVGSCDIAVSSGVLAPRISRKIIHIAASSWIVFWPLFNTDHWTWQLNVTVPAVYAVQLFIKGAILRNPDDPDVRAMTRTGSPTELLNGPLMFALIATYIGLKMYMSQVGVVIISCLGWGDGIAPLVGYFFPCGTHYPTFPFGPNDKKTLTGSLGFWVASLVGYKILNFLILEENREFASGEEEWKMVATVAALMAMVEGLCGAYDNPCIALAAALVYFHLSAE
jgi:dolichol kinase